MPALLSSQELGHRIEEDLNEIEALNDFAASQQRDLTDDEEAKQCDLLGRIENNKKRLTQARKFEEFKAQASSDHPVQNVVPLTAKNRPEKPWNSPKWDVPNAIQSRTYPGLNAFRGQYATDNAYAAGMQLMAMCGFDEGARFCDEFGIRWTDKRGRVQNAQTEGTDSQGGYTVPDPLSAAVIEYLERVGLAFRICDVVPMTSDTLNEAKITSGQTVYYPGEATGITASDLVFGQVALSVVKRATLTKVSSELRADSIVRIVDRVASRAAYQIALQNDNELINGDGTSTYGSETGINTAMGAAGEVAGAGNLWSELTLQNFNDLLALLPDEHHEGASFVCSRSFFHSVMERLIVAQGGSTGTELANGTGRQFLGYPVNFTSKMPTSEANSQRCVFFGNFQNAVMVGNREQVQTALSDEFAFDEDVTTVRVTERIDINVHEASDGSTAKAIVAIETAAA